jgi:CheY-like chemotaxis protein
MNTDHATTLIARLRAIVSRPDDRRPLSVLIVDDDDLVLRYASRVLREAGYKVVTACGASEAMAVASTDGPFDVLLTDLMMPRMNGDELARRLRVGQPDMAVLYFTGFSDRLFLERDRLWAGEAFLDKPCSPRGLVEAVAQVLATEY